MTCKCWAQCSEGVLGPVSAVGSAVQVFCVPTDLSLFLVALDVGPSMGPTDAFCHVLPVIERSALKSPTSIVNLPI